MTNYTKIGLPTLLLLVFLTSCSPSDFTPDYKPSLVEPTSTINYEGKTTDTLQPTSETITPEPEQSTPVVVEKPCLENTGELRAFEIPRGDETLTGNIYTPPCYHETGLSYPTLYLLHGATETEQQWEDLGLVEVVDGLIAREDIPPLIIVMPREDTWISLQDNPYGDYLIQALIPWIDTEYRTLPERHYRAVGGISRGGNWALRLGLLHWGTFGSLGAHSAPLFYGDLNRLPGWLEVIPDTSIPRIYLDISEGDKNLPEAESLRDILKEAGVSLEWHLYPGLHNDAYWNEHLKEYLLWYSAGWSDH